MKYEHTKKKMHTYENCHNITCRRKCEKDGYDQGILEFKNEIIERLNNNANRYVGVSATEMNIQKRNFLKLMRFMKSLTGFWMEFRKIRET